MMHISCPQCSQPIPASQINVQTMVAVCATCDIVFRFDVPDAKAKRRKVKKPDRMIVDDDDGLLMAYRGVLGKENRGAATGISIATTILTFISLLMMNGYAQGEVPLPVVLMIIGLVSFMYYLLSLFFVNQTRISLVDNHLSVAYHPIPNPFDEQPQFDTDDIVQIYCEETEASRKAGSLTQDYHVFAELVDGNRVIIAKELPQAYAFFVAQKLEENLELGNLDQQIANLEAQGIEDDSIDAMAADELEENQRAGQ